MAPVSAYSGDGAPCVLADGRVASLWPGRPGGSGIYELKVMTPDGATIAAAQRAVGVAARLGFKAPTYARIDGVRRNGSFLIMEVELIEPFLFLEGAPGASERFASAVLAALA